MHPFQSVPLRPTQHAEHQLVVSILDGTFPPHTTLPNERSLAAALGVTRPTLRETLHRLAREGWITIRQGRPTMVNDYWQQGGMGLLSTMARHTDDLPDGFVRHLLEVRAHMMPLIARLACRRRPERLLAMLADSRQPDDSAAAFTDYDWQLHLVMAKNSGNPIYTLILNDFTPMFQTLGRRYFKMEKARRASRHYYHMLQHKIADDCEGVEELVRGTMQDSIDLWNHVRAMHRAAS